MSLSALFSQGVITHHSPVGRLTEELCRNALSAMPSRRCHRCRFETPAIFGTKLQSCAPLLANLSSSSFARLRHLPIYWLGVLIFGAAGTIGLSAPLFMSPSNKSNEPFFPGLGTHTRLIKTKSPLTQRYFDQALAFLYGFNHVAAKRSFKAAALNDPECAMSYWGIAISNGPFINGMDLDPSDEAVACNASERREA